MIESSISPRPSQWPSCKRLVLRNVVFFLRKWQMGNFSRTRMIKSLIVPMAMLSLLSLMSRDYLFVKNLLLCPKWLILCYSHNLCHSQCLCWSTICETCPYFCYIYVRMVPMMIYHVKYCWRFITEVNWNFFREVRLILPIFLTHQSYPNEYISKK